MTQVTEDTRDAFRRRGDEPDQVDVHVGRKLRACRLAQGYSQEKLSKRIGVTFQQLQKYENGVNRISASMLHRVAVALDVPHGHFFEGLEEAPDGQMGITTANLWMVRNLSVLSDDEQDRVRSLVKAIASATERKEAYAVYSDDDVREAG